MRLRLAFATTLPYFEDTGRIGILHRTWFIFFYLLLPTIRVMAKKISALSVLMILALIGCKKNDVASTNPVPAPEPKPNTPVISSFAVTDACLRKVSINGANFNTDISKDSISFGEKKGTIDSVTPVHIVATFPPGDISGTIKVWCNGYLGKSSSSFTIVNPIINSVLSRGSRSRDNSYNRRAKLQCKHRCRFSFFQQCESKNHLGNCY